MDNLEHSTLLNLSFFAYSFLFTTLTIFNPRSNYNDFFCAEIGHIISKHSTSFRRYQALHAFNCLGYAFYIVRYSLLAFGFDREEGSLLFEYDIFAYFSRHISVRTDTFFILFAAFLLLYFFFIERLIYFVCPVGTLTLQKYNELVINNYRLYESFFKIQHQSGNGNEDQYYFIKVSKSTKILFSSSHGGCVPNLKTKILFRTVPLRHFPNISDELRLLYIRLAVVIRHSSWAFIVYAGKQA